MHVWIVAIPLPGHIFPLLRLGQELERRGHRVTVVSSDPAESYLRPYKMPLVSLGPYAPGARFDDIASRASASTNFVLYTAEILRFLQALWKGMWVHFHTEVLPNLKDRPDFVVTDLLTYVGTDIAKALGVPVLVNNPCLLPSIPLSVLGEFHEAPSLFSGKSIKEATWLDSALGWVAYRVLYFLGKIGLSREFNIMRSESHAPPAEFLDLPGTDVPIIVNSVFGLEYPRPLPPLVTMVGPMLDLTKVPPIESGLVSFCEKPFIYISMGTCAQISGEALFQLFNACETLSQKYPELGVLWKVSKLDFESLKNSDKVFPKTLRIETWLEEPLSVLKSENCKIFVSHCGINSVHESLTFGVPVLCIPMFGDQYGMAMRVVDAKAGLLLKKQELSAASFVDAVSRMLEEKSFADKAANMSKLLRFGGGLKTAADLVEFYCDIGVEGAKKMSVKDFP